MRWKGGRDLDSSVHRKLDVASRRDREEREREMRWAGGWDLDSSVLTRQDIASRRDHVERAR